MKTLLYAAGPIGRWLALRLGQANKDVTLPQNIVSEISRDFSRRNGKRVSL